MVRFPGANIAPTSSRFTGSNTRVENIGAKAPMTVIRIRGRMSIRAPLLVNRILS